MNCLKNGVTSLKCINYL